MLINLKIMKNIVILLITLLTFSTNILSQTLSLWKSSDGDVNRVSRFGIVYCQPHIYSHNKKMDIKKCDTTKYTYQGEIMNTYKYYIYIKLGEIVIRTNSDSTLVGKYDITKYKSSFKNGNCVYIICKTKSKNQIKKILINSTGLTITTYYKKRKITIVEIMGKGDYIHKMKYNNNIETQIPQN